MKRQSEQTTSYWMATEVLPKFAGLQRDESTDVCIVGAGIAGLTIAYLLTKAGAKVMVLESRHLSAGQTQRTSAHLTNAHDDFYSEVEKVHGAQGIRIAAASHTDAIDLVERIVIEEQIDCDFERIPGYLFCPPGQSTDFLNTELAAAQRAGITGLEIVGRAPITSFDTGRCIRYSHQGQFHPLKYLAQICQAITSLLVSVSSKSVMPLIQKNIMWRNNKADQICDVNSCPARPEFSF